MTQIRGKKGWPWTTEATNCPLAQLSYRVCLTWACHEHHHFLQIIFLSSPLDVWIHWRCLQPQQQTWSSGSWWSALWSVVESLACCQRSGCTLHEGLVCWGFCIHTWECVNYSICHRWGSNLWLVESCKDMTRLLSKQNLTLLSQLNDKTLNDTQLYFGIISII